MSGKWLIIDACVGSASSDKESVQSKHCIKFLLWVYKKEYHAVMSEELCSEWKRHDSEYSIKWRKSMREKRRLHKINCPKNEELRDKISASEYVKKDANVLRIVLKDIHLIELAYRTDKTVISLDEHVRVHFKNISTTCEEIRVIVWVNPTNLKEQPIEWLRNGALPDDYRKLGFMPPKKTLYRNGHKLRKIAEV
ncbi:hypothetical protein [Methanocella sp. MCL-LM]|uniref:hypothetical protein n=1 Tax=Methanocella sp. MCL-LM TaxID=3412035 RepID=UPI003C729756